MVVTLILVMLKFSKQLPSQVLNCDWFESIV